MTIGLFHYFGADHIRGHQVRRELDAAELDPQDVGHGLDQQRLRQPRHARDQAVPAGEQRDQQLVDDFMLADDDLVDFLHDLFPAFLHALDQAQVVPTFHYRRFCF